MLSGSVARRYARAVLLIGQQNHNYDILASEIDRLAATYDKSADLRAILENPAFSMTQRSAVKARPPSAMRRPLRTASAFSTGSTPGNPRHTGQTWALGGAPNAVLHPQKILVAVWSCA